jgi:hypothetical protein
MGCGSLLIGAVAAAVLMRVPAPASAPVVEPAA